LSFL